MKTTLWIIFGITAAISLAMRLWPADKEVWHKDPFDAPNPRPKGYRKEITVSGSPEKVLETVIRIIDTYPRTKIYAGDAKSGRVTFVTFSALWGFPDFTTVAAKADGKKSKVFFLGRTRFGWGDFSTNFKRIKSWIETLQSVHQ